MSEDQESESADDRYTGLEKARAHLLGGSYSDANELLSKLVKADETGYASLYLGALYLIGKGVPLDLELAEVHFSAAADRGIASALHNLGLVCEQRGDFLGAFKWYQQLANQGDPAAMRKIYRLSTRHPEIDIDKQHAVELLKTSAALGDCFARRDLQWLELRGSFGFPTRLKAILLLPFVAPSIIFGIYRHNQDPDRMDLVVN